MTLADRGAMIRAQSDNCAHLGNVKSKSKYLRIAQLVNLAVENIQMTRLAPKKDLGSLGKV
jgi:hypothetical protein